MSEKPKNAMQAALDRVTGSQPVLQAEPRQERPHASEASKDEQAVPASRRPSRRNTRLIGGHFKPELARELRILAAEEDTTIQALLEEALQLLFAKKARRNFGNR